MNSFDSLEPRVLFASGYPVSFGSKTFDGAYKVAAMPDGGSVVAGLFSGTVDFDPAANRAVTLTATGDDGDPTKNANVYVARYGSNGGLVWVKQFAGKEGNFDDKLSRDLPIDPERAGSSELGVTVQPIDLGQYVTAMGVNPATGNIYLAFSFKGAIDFDPGRGRAVLTSTDSNDFSDIALLRLNSNGGFGFVKQIGGRFTDVALGMTLDASDNIYLTGYFSRIADFDPSAKSFVLTNDEGRESSFAAMYTRNGALVWANANNSNSIKKADRTAGYGIAVSTTGAVYVTGSFAGDTDFDPSAGKLFIEPQDDTDIFIQRFDNVGTLVWVKTIGGDGFDAGQAVVAASNGDVIVGSIFSDTIDVDPSPTRTINVTATPEDRGDDPERTDLLIQRFTASGELLWARPVGNQGFETLGAMAMTAGGNIVTTGSFYGALDFNPGRAANVLISTPGVEDFDDPNDDDRESSYDGFVQTLDRNGTFVSATRFGAASDDFSTAISIAPSSSNRATVAGQFRGTYVFPDGNGSQKFRPVGAQDSFVSIFDTDDGKILA